MGGISGKLFQGSNSGSREYAKEYQAMETLVVPAVLEQYLALGDGNNGCPVEEAIKLDKDEIPNLYRVTADQFELAFEERGVAYEESAVTTQRAEVAFNIHQGGTPNFSLRLDPTPVVMWGVNFAGKVIVKHNGGQERLIYLPGTRTYDPAGITGDPHASERIGPSCSRTQLGITIAQVVALHKGGGDVEQLNEMQDKLRPLIVRYHGRLALFEYMKQQIQEAVLDNADVTPYPEFIKVLVKDNKLELSDARKHTRAYLESYNRGLAHPPMQYFVKVSKKDDPEKLFSAEDLAKFKFIIGSEMNW